MTDTATPTHVEPPRDRYGRYLIPDPETGKPVPYTRATTFAKAVSDTFGLHKWMLRMGGIGLAQRQDLLLGVAAADPTDSKTLDRLMAEAKDHAGAASGANIGTALHSFTEAVDRGQTPDIPPPWDADVAAYVAAVADAGLTIVPELIEQVCVVPDLQVAGTFDRIVRTSDGRLVIADLKTGKDVSYAMGEISVQLALYAAATHIFHPDTGELEAMPDVDQAEALVFWAPAGQGRCEVLSVDIAAGRDMFKTITTVRDWRKRRDLSSPYSPRQQAAPPLQPSPTDQLAWVERALHQLSEWEQLPAMAQAWPHGVPTLRQAREDGVELASEQLDAIFRAIVDVAAKAKLDFDLFAEPYPGASEILLPTDPRITELRARLERLPSDLAEIVAGRSGAAGVPKLSSGKATVAHAMIVAANLDDAEAEMAKRRALAAAHLGEFPGDAQPAAMRLAGCETPDQMTQQAAERLGVLADALSLGHIAIDAGDIVVADGAEKVLVDRFGSKRNVIDAAKQAARVLGLARPTSSAQVTSDPMLLAAVFIEGQVPTSEQETS